MKNSDYRRLTMAAFLSLLFLTSLSAQSNEDLARAYIQNHLADWQMQAVDVAELELKNHFESQHNRAWHLYYQQKYQDILIRNALLNLTIWQDKVAFAGNRLVANLSDKVNATQPIFLAEDAVGIAADAMDIPINESLRLQEQLGAQVFLFEKGTVSQEEIRAELAYFLNEENRLQLVWEVTLNEIGKTNFRTISVDALNGGIVHNFNRTLYCDFGKGHFLAAGEKCEHEHLPSTPSDISEQALKGKFAPKVDWMENNTVVQDARYNIWEFPIESPADGELIVRLNPHDEVASPFGWHDEDGDDEIDYSITRGNNAHAYADVNDSNQSQGNEPDGGTNLFFAPPFNPDWEPDQYQDQAVTQLFYSTNMLHDISYRLGFDEAAGNYQETNFTGEGQGGDGVFAEAQNGGTSASNNANFNIVADGQNGRMQLYLWSQQGLLTVNEPISLSGIYETREAQFGDPVTNTPVSGEVVMVDDGSALPTLGCFELQNADEINGKIAMVDRGECDYSLKVLNAQNAGAIACVVCSFDGGSFNPMGAGDFGGQVDIPSVLINYADCQVLRQFAGSGLNVSLVLPQSNGPERLDGALDNTTVAHEYAHGISVRLTGGSGTASCLNNDEQMGEGWSDFFALATTAKPDQDGTEPRGISTYSLGQSTDGAGARRFPYSTDFSINSQTYFDIIGGVRPHPVGEVWAAILWDLHWAMVDEYGFDEDLFNGTGGNNLALQLVVDGMKLQSCSPGFEDGRDAILMADQMNNGGENQCLIWEVFARRGVGFQANQRSSNSRNDGTESYAVLPECVKELKITKSMTDLIEAGEEIEVILQITNHKDEEVSGVSVTDLLPEGTDYILGSSSNSTVVVDGNTLNFALNGTMASGESRIITYKLSTSTDASVTFFLDDMEDSDDGWNIELFQGDRIWELSNDQSVSGSKSWFADASDAETDFALEKDPSVEIPVDMEQPVLRFQHWFDTEWGFDGGIVELSTDYGATWEVVGDKMFRNGYETVLSFFAFNVSKMPAFAGDGDSFRPTYVDLSAYAGEAVRMRFRFATDEEDGNENGTGWYIDDIELMDMVNYNSEACVTSNEGDQNCAEAPARGTIVQSDMTVGATEELENIELAVFPNPAQNQLQLKIVTEKATQLAASLVALDGKIVLEKTLQVSGEQHFSLDVQDLAEGFYFLKIGNEEGVVTKKVILAD